MLPLPEAKPVNSLSKEPPQAASPGLTEKPGSVPAISWQRDLAGAIRSVSSLLAEVGLTEGAVPPLSCSASESFRLLVPQSFVRRIEPGNAADPLLRQVLPLAAENDVVPGFLADAVGDGAARQVPGLLQKYHGRALLIAAGSCAVHCRYCFRRDYPYGEEPRRLVDWEPAFAELSASPEISEVILSGGDPLMLPDERLMSLIERLDAIPHIDRIRIHSRLPIVLPSRVTDALLGHLRDTRAQVITVVHANHAREIVDDCRAALRQLVASGLPVLNQTVLLNGVNDSVDALESLSTALVNIGVLPYYLHQLDRVSGTAHFEVDRDVGQQLIAELRRRLPGYAVPRFVQEIAGNDSKTPL